MKVRKNATNLTATRIFTDREEPRAAFWKKYSEVKAQLQSESDIHILNYYGIGGIGKSSLLKKLMSEMDERISSPKYIYVDFGKTQERRAVLEKMRNLLAEKYKFSFPLFELACYVYSKKIGEKADPVEVKQLTQKSQFLSTLLSISEELPVVGIATKILSVADQGIAFVRTYLAQHKRSLQQIEYMDAEDLYNHLPFLFAQDMEYNLEKHKLEPLVIFLDTYEELVNELSFGGEPLKNDEWVRGTEGLAQNISSVLWVIAGREKLKWEIFDPDWSEAIESHLLGSLSVEDSKQFLQKAGVADENLSEQLYKLTDGTPVYLDLCVDQFYNVLNNGGKPDISMFGKNTFDLIERFIRYMNEQQKDLVYALVCLNRWNDKLFDGITAVFPSFSLSAYEKVKSFSFVIKSDDESFHIHQTIGKVLIEKCPDTIKKRVGNFLFESFSDILKEKQLLSLSFSEALLYVTQAGLLLYKDREAFFEFYKENISQNLTDLAKAGRFEQAENAFELLLPFAEQNKNDLFYASIISVNSILLCEKGNYSSAKLLAEKALELCTEICGEDDPTTLKAMSALAGVMERLGDYQKALELDQTVLKKRTELLGEEHPDTIDAMHCLGLTFHLLGENRKALELQELVLEKRKAILGENHPDTIKAVNNLAITLNFLGEYKRALELNQAVFDKRMEILGENHPDTIKAMNNLAISFANFGKHQKALELRQTVLEKNKAVLGEDHPGTILAINNLANTFDCLGDYQEALKLKQIALEKKREIFGENHPLTISAMNNLAKTLNNLGEYQKALELKDAVFEKRKEAFGENHPATISALNNIAITLSSLGEYRKALELYQTVFEKRKAILGGDHPNTISSKLNLGVTLYRLGQLQKAKELLQEVYEKRLVVLGENHPDTIKAKNILESLIKKTGEIK